MANSQYSAKQALLWSILEKCSSQLLSFIIGLVLARLLSPTDYGTIGLIAIFLAVSNVFVDAGFASALIRKLDRNSDDLTTAFYFNVGVGFVVLVLLCVLSPLISDFFDEPLLVPLVIISAINLFVNTFGIVQNTILTASLNIKKQTIINFIAQIPSGAVAIYMAYNGYGVYSLSFQILIASIVRVVLLWATTDWRPAGRWSRISFDYLWGFGSKLLLANLIGSAFNEIYSFVIGMFFKRSELGYFTKSQQLTMQVNTISSGVIMKIALPILSRYQNDKPLLVEKFREMMSMLMIVVSPLAVFLGFYAKDIVLILWGDEWMECSSILSVLILGIIFMPVSQMNLSLFQAIGRTDVTLKMEIPKKIIYCIVIAVGLLYGVMGVVVAAVCVYVIAACINMLPTRKLIGYRYRNQIWDILKYIVVSLLSLSVPCMILHFESPWLSLFVSFMVSASIYFLFLYISRDQLFGKFLRRLINIRNL